MIDRTHQLPVARQAELLNGSRGSVYYLPKPMSETDLNQMRRMDELHLERPFAGARMLRRMGVEALYRRPHTSRKHPGHPVQPVLRALQPLPATLGS